MKYIVDFHNNAPDAEITQYLSNNGCTVLKEWDNFDKVFLVEAASEPPLTSIVAHVKDDEHKLAFKPLDVINFNPYHRLANDPNFPSVTISTTDTKDWWKNYSLASPVFDQPTTTYSQKGNNVHVYIMDSGIEASHPEFQGVEISNVYSVTPGDFSDNRGHGTALASVVSGKTCGISSAKLKIVKIFDPGHDTLQSEFLDALDAVMADLPEGYFGILNCSWTIPRNEWVEFKLKECIDDGLWIIAAAGNNGTPIENVTPAAMPEAFTIGSYNMDLQPSDFSNYSNGSSISYTPNQTNHGSLDGWAPGEQIYCAALNGGYAFSAGTSLACAITSAITAHNLNDMCYEDGRKLPGTEGFFLAGPGASPALVLGRKDILDLSDPKYSTSINAIATIKDNVDQSMPPDESHNAVRAGTKKTLSVLFNPQLTKSIELIDPLPANFEILRNGSLYGAPTVEQGPAAGEAFKQYTAKMKRVSSDDVEEIVTIEIYVLDPNYQPSDLPNDHIIPITLATGCQGAPNLSCGFLYSNNCLNSCSGGQCCGSGKSTSCGCLG
jgi:hypothetical protein